MREETPARGVVWLLLPSNLTLTLVGGTNSGNVVAPHTPCLVFIPFCVVGGRRKSS